MKQKEEPFEVMIMRSNKSPWPLYIGIALILSAVAGVLAGSINMAIFILVLAVILIFLSRSSKKDMILGKIKRPEIGAVRIPWGVIIFCLISALFLWLFLGFYLWEAVVTAGALFAIWLAWKGLGKLLISPFYRRLDEKGQTWMIWLAGLIIVLFAGVVCGTMLLEFLYKVFNIVAYS